jgi:putative FmdB family regulatory protein
VPKYDYRCPECKKEHTEVRSMTEPQIKKLCEDCKVELVRVYGVAAVTFNGEGFYANDKRRKD